MTTKVASRPRSQLLTLQVAYLAALAFFFVVKGIFPGPSFMFLLCAVVLVWHVGTRGFLIDFFPFAVLLFSYEMLRGFADDLSLTEINIQPLIDAETWLFGGVPAVWLQAWDPSVVEPLSLICNVFYLSHFVVPFIVAFMLWRSDVQHYWPFVLGLTAMSYAGFVCYLIYPAAPPWYAGQYGLLQVTSLTSFYVPRLMEVSPNPVAAMPSLHAAYPTFITLYCMRVWGRRAAWLWILPLAVSFAAVFLGHHYVIDLLAGYAFGAVFCLLTNFYVRSRFSVSRDQVEV